MNEPKILGYFMETGVYFHGFLQPPRRTNVTMIGSTINFDINNYKDDDEIPVFSEEGNWYHIKKKELHLLEE